MSRVRDLEIKVVALEDRVKWLESQSRIPILGDSLGWIANWRPPVKEVIELLLKNMDLEVERVNKPSSEWKLVKCKDEINI